MDNQNEINNDLIFLAKSEIRLKILSELHNKPNNVRGLVDKTKINYSSVSSNISKLEHNNYIKKISNKYHINPMTEMYFKTFMEFKDSVDLITNYTGFWDKHNINWLSIDSIKSITDLNNSELVETTPIDIYKTHKTIKNQLLNSHSIKAIFPYLHPEYPQLIENILKNNGTVELIMPKPIYKATISRIDDNIIKKASEKQKLKIHSVDEDLSIYLTITDDSMSLGLFRNDGSFDQNRILISKDKKSKDWAKDLFKTIKHDVIK